MKSFPFYSVQYFLHTKFSFSELEIQSDSNKNALFLLEKLQVRLHDHIDA